MKKLMSTGAAIALSMIAGAASAADLPRGGASYYSPASPAVYNWAGPYVGATLGYQWGSVTNSATRPSGIAGGLTGAGLGSVLIGPGRLPEPHHEATVQIWGQSRAQWRSGRRTG